MDSKDKSFAVCHLEGGNRFDDMRIDIEASHRRMDQMPRTPLAVVRAPWQNRLRLLGVRASVFLRIREALVLNGLLCAWLDDFKTYWSQCLGGRPLWNAVEFFQLLYDYRKKQQ